MNPDYERRLGQGIPIAKGIRGIHTGEEITPSETDVMIVQHTVETRRCRNTSCENPLCSGTAKFHLIRRVGLRPTPPRGCDEPELLFAWSIKFDHAGNWISGVMDPRSTLDASRSFRILTRITQT